MTEIFEVGGCVRDRLMGLTPKDIDFSVVAGSFEEMDRVIRLAGMKVVQSKPEFGTIRAIASKPFMGHTGGLDFVWARIDGPSSDGRRPDWTRPGTLMDDLARRDFTMNAIAMDDQSNLIDPFGGQADIEAGIIRCVGDPRDRLEEDALRALRAMRFAVTKGFTLDGDLEWALTRRWLADSLDSVSKERQREEMEKMFAHDTVAALLMLQRFPLVMSRVFSNGLRLSATMKQ